MARTVRVGNDAEIGFALRKRDRQNFRDTVSRFYNAEMCSMSETVINIQGLDIQTRVMRETVKRETHRWDYLFLSGSAFLIQLAKRRWYDFSTLDIIVGHILAIIWFCTKELMPKSVLSMHKYSQLSGPVGRAKIAQV